MSESLVKRVLRNLVPPIIWKVIVREAGAHKEGPSQPDELFDGQDQPFKEIVSSVSVYAEYGMGRTTVWTLKNTRAHVLAVDSDLAWVEKVKSETSALSRLDATHVDLGQLVGWGRPSDYSKRENFQKYTDSIWLGDRKPQAVLVDGRFRVCCFLTCLKYADEATIIIFDDYTNRPGYHIVEEFLRPVRIEGRQAIFVVPEKGAIDHDLVKQYIERFRYVMD